MIRKLAIGFVVVLAIGVGAYLRFHHRKPLPETAYAGNRQVILYSTTAQVREQIATLNYGERVDVLDRFGDQVQVRTASGVIGWTTQEELLSADFWQKAKNLEANAAPLPPQAVGHTRVLSNLHIEPARESPRVRQLDRGVPLEILERQTVEVQSTSTPAPSVAGVDSTSGGSDAGAAKKEDWWLVRAHIPDQVPGAQGAAEPDATGMTLSGWILGRFVDLDVPAPLPDYASSAGMRIVAWFELNRVADNAGNPKSQYLVLGTRGPEGQPCDFKLIRVFTWGKQKQRYETAYVESDLCGKLPVTVTPAKFDGGDAAFAFQDWSKGKAELAMYRMHQTIVRRVRAPGAATPPSRPSSVSKRARRKHARG